MSVQDLTDDAVAGKKLSVFQKIFPEPTGTNGFEEIIRAGEPLRDVEREYSLVGGVPLSKKREYLALPVCQDALRLLRIGLAKPLFLPRTSYTTDHYEAYACLRALARLLATSVYVACADGRTDNAVRIAGDVLTFTHALQGVSYIGSLTAISVEAIVLKPLVQLRDSLSVADCRRLTRLMEQSLAKPDQAYRAFSVERGYLLGMVAAWREKWDGMFDVLEQLYAPSEDVPETPQYRESLRYAALVREDPTVRERVLNEMLELITQHFDCVDAMMRDPTGRLVLMPPPNADANRHPMVPLLRNAFFVVEETAVRKSVQRRVSLQLVAIHAAIRAFRWENDRLPKTLDELELRASLVTDPFTAKSILYDPEATGTGYALASAGALFPGANGKPDFRERITFPWTKPK